MLVHFWKKLSIVYVLADRAVYAEQGENRDSFNSPVLRIEKWLYCSAATQWHLVTSEENNLSYLNCNSVIYMTLKTLYHQAESWECVVCRVLCVGKVCLVAGPLWGWEYDCYTVESLPFISFLRDLCS